MNRTLQSKSFQADFVALVTEENAVRAIATMVERTTGLDVDELLLPEDSLGKHKEATRLPNEEEGDGRKMEVNELGEERVREKIDELTKRASGTKKNKENKPQPPEKVLNQLVGIPALVPWPLPHSLLDQRSRCYDHNVAQCPDEPPVAVESSPDRASDKKHQL